MYQTVRDERDTMSSTPVVVYLDQNHWIYLSRVAHGRRDAEVYREAFEVLERASREGRVVLPLSWFHFLETHQCKDSGQRLRLATTMTTLGRCAAIAPLSRLVPEQLIQAIARSRGIVRVPRTLNVLGRGVAHAFGQEPISMWDGAPFFQEAVLSRAAVRLSPEEEKAAEAMIGELRRRHRERAELWEDTRDWARTEGKDALLRAHLARSAIDFSGDIRRGLVECGLALPAGDEQVRWWLTQVLDSVPELRVRIDLGVLRDRQRDRPIEGNDLRDLDALSVAIPRCHVVVTEKFWHALTRQSQLEHRFRVRVLSRLSELPSTLRSLGVSS
jgi:hypothetical protein